MESETLRFERDGAAACERIVDGERLVGEVAQDGGGIVFSGRRFAAGSGDRAGYFVARFSYDSARGGFGLVCGLPLDQFFDEVV